MKDFFIDTADVNYIRNLWEKIKDKVDPKTVRGITTNPNAFFKVGKNTLKEWLDAIPELCEVINEIRGDNKGILYVQGPNSKMTWEEQKFYVNMIVRKTGGKARIGLKIPPFTEILEGFNTVVNDMKNDIEINVTGVADAGTALKCFTYPRVRFVSIIPGRMEEAGIDAKAHLAFAGTRVNHEGFPSEIISGSMRTIDGLIMTWKQGTVPTIGERVWNILLESDSNFERIINIDYSASVEVPVFCPEITDANTKLSVDFFAQMDKCGEVAYADLTDAFKYLKTYF